MCENDIFHRATMVKAFVKSGPEMETATQKSTVGWLLGALDFCMTLDSFLSLPLSLVCSNDKATSEPNEKTLKAIYRINLT